MVKLTKAPVKMQEDEVTEVYIDLTGFSPHIEQPNTLVMEMPRLDIDWRNVAEQAERAGLDNPTIETLINGFVNKINAQIIAKILSERMR